MAKAFDLVHRVVSNQKEESRIPFEDQDKKSDDEPLKKKRVRIEVAFFYLLLLIVFFIMGYTFLSPTFLGGLGSGTASSPEPNPLNSPAAGFTIDKEGKSVEEAAKDLKISPSPLASLKASAPVSPAVSEKPAAATNQAARIQIQNGTNITGAAASLRTKLANKGIVVASIGNYKKRSVVTTTIFYKPDYKTAAEQVQAISGGILSTATTGIGDYDILVVIGQK